MANTLDLASVETKFDLVLEGLVPARLALVAEERLNEVDASRMSFRSVPLREALIRGRTSEQVTLYWRLFYDRRADGYVLWLEPQARPRDSEPTARPAPTRAESVNHVSADDILHTMQMNVRERMIAGVQALLARHSAAGEEDIIVRRDTAGESHRIPFLDGNLWATGDGKIFMWSTAERGDESAGYTIRLRDGVAASELVDEALREKNA